MAHATTSSEAQSTADLQALLREAEQALANTAGDVGVNFGALREKLRVALDGNKDSLDRLRAEAARRTRQADRFVRDNPYYAIGVAAGVGALVGLLISRSCNSSR